MKLSLPFPLLRGLAQSGAAKHVPAVKRAMQGDEASPRQDTATKREAQIRTAIEGQDENLTAELITELIFARSDDEHKNLLTDLQKELVKAEVQADPLRRHFVERLLWSVEAVLGVPGDTSAVARRYKEKVAPAYAKATTQGELFHKKLKEAEDGSSEAQGWLAKEYGDAILQDFMGTRKGEFGALR